MLSKYFSHTFKSICFQGARNMSYRRAAFDFFYRDDKLDPVFINSTFDPRRPLSDHTGKVREELPRQWKSTKLDNGITVLTESASFPNQVDLGILLDVGTRDENNETSGSLLSIQNTYLKTILNTNETINYGIVQMSGGNFEMEYDQESAYFQARCLGHDVTDVFNMVADCALEPRSVIAAQVGQYKNKNSHELDKFLKTGEDFNDAVFRTAFGLKGLGLPLKGLKGNIENLTSYTLQKFQLDTINPSRIFVSAAGVESHEEFVELVNAKLKFIPSTYGKKTIGRNASAYVGGEVRNLSEDSVLTVGLFFQGANWKSQDLHALQVANTLLNYGRLRNLLKKSSFLDCACGFNFNFSDSGLFGIRVTGAASNSKQLVDSVTAEYKNLASKVSADELARAKAILKTNIFKALERQTDRLEEGTKNFRTFGKVVFDTYASSIDKVTGDQVSKAVSGLFKSAPTFVAWGGEANRLPSYDAVRNSFK